MRRTVFSLRNVGFNLRAWMHCILISLFTLPALSATDYYFLPNSVGSNNGTSFSNAYGWNDFGATGIADFLNSTMSPGDTLYIGSGNYHGQKLTITSSGTTSAPKRLIGIDTGTGRPVLTKGSWSRNSPSSGNHSLIQFDVAGAAYWHFSGFNLSGAQHGIHSPDASASIHHIQFSDITISQVRYGLYISNLDNSSFENVTVTEYTKHGFRLEKKSDSIDFINCTADLSGGDSSWWNYSESFPFGFNIVGTSGANSNITFSGCLSMNNRMNGQSSGDYWNGDGYSVENPNTNINFESCLAFDNDDAGFDIKPQASFTGCISFGNKRNFRLWYGTSSIDNSISGYASNRGGTGSVAGVWVKNANATLDHVTIHGSGGRAIHEDGSGSVSILNSILSFTTSGNTTTTGSVSLDTSTESHEPGSGTDPDYVNDSSSWDGQGNDFNSQTYGISKGYYWGEPEIILDSENTTGITLTGNWLSGNSTSGFHGSNYLHDSDNGKGNKSVRYTPTIPSSGFYEVAAMWTAHSNRASNTPIDVTHSAGSDLLSIDQRYDGGTWFVLGTYYFNAGSSGSVLISNTGTNGYVIADAVRFTQTTPISIIMDSEDTSGITQTGTWLSSTGSVGYLGSGYLHDNDGGKGSKSVRYTPTISVPGDYEVFALWTAHSNRASNTPIDIVDNAGSTTVVVNQRGNNGVWVSLGTYNFSSGSSGYIEIRNTGTNGYVVADGVMLVQMP